MQGFTAEQSKVSSSGINHLIVMGLLWVFQFPPRGKVDRVDQEYGLLRLMVFFNYILLLLLQCDNLSLNLDHQHTLSLAGQHHTYVKGKTIYYNSILIYITPCLYSPIKTQKRAWENLKVYVNLQSCRRRFTQVLPNSPNSLEGLHHVI